MNRRNCWTIGLMLIVFVPLLVRFVWSVSNSRYGWDGHFRGWVVLARTSLGLNTQALENQDPRYQARVWLNEVGRVKAATEDPEIALGAAWMLDSPQLGFMGRYLRNSGINFPGAPKQVGLTFDNDQIESLVDDFENLCRDECLRKISLATELDPTNVEIWRARALLTFRSKNAGFELVPRQANWVEVLDECARHDPGNALYDYLATLCLWNQSATYKWAEQGFQQTVSDAVRFQESNRRLESALDKPFLKFGTKSYAATRTFLTKTSLPAKDFTSIAGSREIQNRSIGLLFWMIRRQSIQLDVAKAEGELEKAMIALRCCIRLSDQMTRSENGAGAFHSRLFGRRWALANLRLLNKSQPGLMTEHEVKLLNQDQAETCLAVEMHQAALKNINQRVERQKKSASKSSVGIAFAMITAQMLVVMTIVGALIIALLAWMSRTDVKGPVRMGWWRHIVAWVVGLTFSVLVLGLGSSWFFPGAGTKSDALGPKREDVQDEVISVIANSGWVWLQWQAYCGPLATLLIAAAILSVWDLMRRAVHIEGGCIEVLRSNKRSQIYLTSRMLMRSFLSATAICLIIYMALFPAIPRQQPADEVLFEGLFDPRVEFDLIDTEVARIQADQPAMKEIRARISEAFRRSESAS